MIVPFEDEDVGCSPCSLLLQLLFEPSIVTDKLLHSKSQLLNVDLPHLVRLLEHADKLSLTQKHLLLPFNVGGCRRSPGSFMSLHGVKFALDHGDFSFCLQDLPAPLLAPSPSSAITHSLVVERVLIAEGFELLLKTSSRLL